MTDAEFSTIIKNNAHRKPPTISEIPPFDRHEDEKVAWRQGFDAAVAEIIALAEKMEFCPMCGTDARKFSHYCPKCNERFSVADDAYWFYEYLKKKYLKEEHQ